MRTVWLQEHHDGDRVFYSRLLDFAQHYGFRPRLRRRRPQIKGKIATGIRYVGKAYPRPNRGGPWPVMLLGY